MSHAMLHRIQDYAVCRSYPACIRISRTIQSGIHGYRAFHCIPHTAVFRIQLYPAYCVAYSLCLQFYAAHYVAYTSNCYHAYTSENIWRWGRHEFEVSGEVSERKTQLYDSGKSIAGGWRRLAVKFSKSELVADVITIPSQ